jgi:addiction module HigA family antidote
MTGVKPAHPGMVFKFKHADCRGINATQMAKSLDVRWATMSETFSGKRRVNLKMAAKFAEYTGETILYWYQMQINRDVWEYERKIL